MQYANYYSGRFPKIINFHITTECNSFCDYCFVSHMKGNIEHTTISDFEFAIDYLINAGVAGVRLCGGEPTLNPFIEHFVSYMKNEVKYDIITNSSMSEKLLNSLIKENNKLQFSIKLSDRTKQLINIIDQYNIEYNMYHVITDVKFNVDELVSKILDIKPKKFSLKISLPSLYQSNNYIKNPLSDSFGERLYRLIKNLYSNNIIVYNNCFIPPCIFTPDQLIDIFDNTKLFEHEGCHRYTLSGLIINHKLDVFYVQNQIELYLI